MSLLTLKNVTVHEPSRLLANGSEQARLLVENVVAELSSGEVLSIIGPNGAGKSTLLKAIAGDLSYGGQISIEGVCLDPKLRARQIAVLPQLSLLNFPFRVSEVVGLARIPHSTGSQRDQQIIKEALTMMDIDFLANRLYTELSGGERQRVQLARVLAQIWNAGDAPNGCRMLLLDEPTAALDLGHQQQLMEAIRLFAAQGVGVLMVLHDINLAAQYSDNLLALLCSQQIAFGRPKDVITAKNLKILFDVEANVIEHPTHAIPVVIG